MNFRFAIVTVFTLTMLVGCGSDSDMGYVTGVVTLDGKPVGGASVTFYPADGRSSSGFTDVDGNYELSQTTDRKGAAPGEYKVTVFQDEVDALEAGGENFELPVKYADKKKTDLTETVELGSNEIDLELMSK